MPIKHTDHNNTHHNNTQTTIIHNIGTHTVIVYAYCTYCHDCCSRVHTIQVLKAGHPVSYIFLFLIIIFIIRVEPLSTHLNGDFSHNIICIDTTFRKLPKLALVSVHSSNVLHFLSDFYYYFASICYDTHVYMYLSPVLYCTVLYTLYCTVLYTLLHTISSSKSSNLQGPNTGGLSTSQNVA